MQPLTSYLQSFKAHRRSIGSGLIGQGLNFVAMLLPIVFGRIDEVAFLVTATAVAGVASYTFTWSFVSVYPGIVAERAAAIATFTSGGLLIVAAAMILAVGIIPTPLSVGLRQVAGWAGILTLPLGLNLMVTGFFIRNQNYSAIARLRLVSGGSNSLLILIACLIDTHYPPLLVIPTAMSLGLTAVWGIHQNRDEIATQIGQSGVQPIEIWGHLRSNLNAAVAALLGGAAFQLMGVATPLMGAAANGWAVAVRLAGGFATVSQQVLAPMFEVDFACAVRSGNFMKASVCQRRTYMLGSAYAMICAVGVFGIIIVVQADKAITGFDHTLLLAGVAIYSFSILSTSLLPRNLVIAGGQSAFFKWAAVKLFIGVFLLAVMSGVPLLLGLAVLEAVFQFAYYVVAAKHLDRLAHVQPPPA